MWTNGIWEVTRIETDKEYVWVTCEQNCIAKIAVPKKFENEQIANAERICQCVNGWDDLVKQRDALLEASEKLIKSLGNCSGSFNYNPKIEDDVRTAIANCRK